MGNTTFANSSANINFASTLSGAYNLIVNSAATVIFGNTVNAATLTTNAVTTQINGGSITTSGNQTYNNVILLGSTTTLTSTSGAININQGVSGNQDLNLTSGSGNVAFNLAGALAAHDITVTGGAGNNTLSIQPIVSADPTLTFTLNGSNAGTVTGLSEMTGNFGFSGTQNIIGSSGNNNFVISGGTVSGSIVGSSGTNNLTGGSSTNSFVVTGTDSGSVTGIIGAFSQIQNLIGGSGTNNFILSGGTLSGAVIGGSGTNTLTANAINNTWTLSGSASGTVNGIGSGFSNIQNLVGGASGNNNFIFSDGMSFAGTINGGNITGINTLDYTAYTTPINLYLTSMSSNNGVGITTDNSSATITSFANIQNVTTNGQGTLTLPASNSGYPITLTLAAALQGSINDPVYFNGFNVFTGQGTNNTAILPTGAVYDPNTNLVTFNGITMTFNGFQNFQGVYVPPPAPPTITGHTPCGGQHHCERYHHTFGVFGSDFQ